MHLRCKFIFSILMTASFTDARNLAATHYPDYHLFHSYLDFKTTLTRLIVFPEGPEHTKRLNIFWDSLKANHQVPFAFNDTVAFLFAGNAGSVSWAGDFNRWNATAPGYAGSKLGGDNIWFLEKNLPADARLDYKIVVDGNWMLDPANSYIQYSGFGPNSELRMPAWKYPLETILKPGINRGQLSSDLIMHSREPNLNYDVKYKVYTPYGYYALSPMPVIYVTDGHEYADELRGAMLIVLDNLIAQKKIKPVIAVFIDPRDPINPDNNRRMKEYTGNSQFVNFVADE